MLSLLGADLGVADLSPAATEEDYPELESEKPGAEGDAAPEFNFDEGPGGSGSKPSQEEIDAMIAQIEAEAAKKAPKDEL